MDSFYKERSPGRQDIKFDFTLDKRNRMWYNIEKDEVIKMIKKEMKEIEVYYCDNCGAKNCRKSLRE